MQACRLYKDCPFLDDTLILLELSCVAMMIGKTSVALLPLLLTLLTGKRTLL